MTKFCRYDFAAKGYINKLIDAAQGEVEVSELISASAAVQDALSEIRDFNSADRDFIEATSDYISALAAVVKGKSVEDLDAREAAYVLTRRRVIVEAPVSQRSFSEAA
jgi:hypothetical protein|nr:hypothetical protein [Neorhizobium tomejilense]